MYTKTLLLATISIFAVTPEIFGTDTRDICANPPVSGFPGSTLSKWGYYPDAKECRMFIWGGIEGNGNHFDTEKECTDACRPEPPPKPVKNYNVVSGQCVCRCPRCDVYAPVKPVARATVVATKIVESPAKTTEKSVQSEEKLITSTQVTSTTAEPTVEPTLEPTSTESSRSWFSKLFHL